MNDRRVHFSVPIHKIEYLDKQWETASRQARDGSDWLRMGLDRERFRNRIERTAEILSNIFDSDFRQLIYQERFQNFVIPEPKTKATIKSSTSEEFDTAATEATSTLLKDQSTPQTQLKQTKHNNKKRSRNRRGKKYHSKHRGRH